MSSAVPLRILHLEDDADYSKLVRDLLACEGCDADVVDVTGRQAFEAAHARIYLLLFIQTEMPAIRIDSGSKTTAT